MASATTTSAFTAMASAATATASAAITEVIKFQVQIAATVNRIFHTLGWADKE